jgi:predicted dehydrogenase
LGTGYIADWHTKALSTIPGVSLVAVCDKDLSRTQAFGHRYGVARSYESLDAMLIDGELALDAVHVLLPPNLHARAASALIERSMHVLLDQWVEYARKFCHTRFSRMSQKTLASDSLDR